MPEGSCFCGNVRISYEGEPVAKAICHCSDCRKITGTTYSTNLIVPTAGFRVTAGTPKTVAKTADTGNTVTSHFCGDCGSTLFRDGPTFGDNTVIKVGVLDDPAALDAARPALELFAPNRVAWVPEVPGAKPMDGMPS
ncbi:hypothetical protein SLS62_010967 [Diatrype stigma]|uniref:CENP-V/GFA domain-containing protein n=1 Tax=Diatrype stigma TaxID=117547 RepID=A0AAN9U6B6_9PEZI